MTTTNTIRAYNTTRPETPFFKDNSHEQQTLEKIMHKVADSDAKNAQQIAELKYGLEKLTVCLMQHQPSYSSGYPANQQLKTQNSANTSSENFLQKHQNQSNWAPNFRNVSAQPRPGQQPCTELVPFNANARSPDTPCESQLTPMHLQQLGQIVLQALSIQGNQATQRPFRFRQKPQCFACGKYGHLAKFCRSVRRDGRGRSPSRPNSIERHENARDRRRQDLVPSQNLNA